MVMELLAEKMVARAFAPGGFAEYMVKDLGMALEQEGEEEGCGGGGGGGGAVVLPGAAMRRQLFQGMVANGDGMVGLHGLITVLETINSSSEGGHLPSDLSDAK